MMRGLMGVLVALAFASTAMANDTSFSLTPQDENGGGGGGGAWVVEGPYSFRGADVESVGTVEFNLDFNIATSDDGTDDDFGTSLMLQWGFHEGHQLDVSLPTNYFDGNYAGNGDVSVGWQWKLWDEGAWDCPMMPAFAVYNGIRLPTGYQSSGVDYELRGVFTKTLQEGWRLHVDPFIKFLGGDNIESNLEPDMWGETGSQRNFQAGVVVGTDYRLTDTTVLNAAYIVDSGVLDGYSMQHAMEAGLTYQLAANQTLGWVARWTMDGDDQGDNFAVGVRYAWTVN